MKKLKVLTAFLLLFSCYAWGREHVVQRGETFESIATTYGVAVPDIMKLNPRTRNCHVGMKLSIPDPPPMQVVAENNASVGNNSKSEKKVDGWKIAGAIVGFLADAADAYVQTQNNMNGGVAQGHQHSHSHGQLQQQVAAASGQFVSGNGRTVKYLVAKNGILTVSNDPDVVQRYQEITDRCLVDYQITRNGEILKTGYYKCSQCRGTALCSLCHGKGVMSSGYACICKGTGRCPCAGPEGDFGYIASDHVDYFPGWNLAFFYVYDNNGNRLSGRNYNAEKRERNEELEKRLNKNMAECSTCHGTGVNPSPMSTSGLIDLNAYYNESGTRCPYCSEVNGHWHYKCTICMGKMKTFLMEK